MNIINRKKDQEYAKNSINLLSQPFGPANGRFSEVPRADSQFIAVLMKIITVIACILSSSVLASPPESSSSTKIIPSPRSPGYVRPPNKLPDEAVEALKSGVKFILFSLDPLIAFEAEKEKLKPEENHHGFKILGSTELVNPETKTTAIASLADAVRNFNGIAAGCFFPRHSLRVITAKGATYDFVTCFECYHIEVYLGEKRIGGAGIFGSQEQLDKILTAAKIPLPKPPEAGN